MGHISEFDKSRDLDIINSLSKVTGVVYSDEQKKILTHRGGMCIIACAGSGKALANGTGVLTPTGYVNIENLSVGDKVLGANGVVQEVLGVYPQEAERVVWEVRFKNNRVIRASSDHLWAYKDFCDSKADYVIGTTRDMCEAIESGRFIGVPINKECDFGNIFEASEDNYVDPYLIGVIASDTDLFTRNCNSISIRVDKLEEKNGYYDIVSAIFESIGIKLENQFDSFKYELKSTTTGALLGLKYKLCKLGLLTESGENLNRIPDSYKYGSIETRLEVLRGIFDSRAGISGGNTYSVRLKNITLMNDVKFILESLGFRGIGMNTSNYVLTVPITYGSEWLHTIGGLSDKIDIERLFVPADSDLVVSIRETDEFAEMTCIKVSGEDELFLTENCIVTHNTTVLTHLLAKRIQSGEIGNTDTLLCTTYSKSGAMEMEQRLNKLLKQVGIRRSVTVKTMHALYLSVLKYFGYPAAVISNQDRAKYLREACKEVDITLDEEDFQTLDSLLSYQINNLMNDADLVQSYAYTLDSVPLEKYSAIRQGYSKRKVQNKVIDFDDMQLYMYIFLYQQKRDDIIEYCRSNWTDIYVDEAQDMSRIQYLILKKIVTDPDRLVIIGDDDQCLVEGTTVSMGDGTYKNIEDIVPGDRVLGACGYAKTGSYEVDKVFCSGIVGDVVRVRTESGHEIIGTPGHTVLTTTAKEWKRFYSRYKGIEGTEYEKTMRFIDYLEDLYGDDEPSDAIVGLEMFRPSCKSKCFIDFESENDGDINFTGETDDIDEGIRIMDTIYNKIKMVNPSIEKSVSWVLGIKEGEKSAEMYSDTLMKDVEVGSHIPIVVNGRVIDDIVKSVSIEHYSGKVYDISVPEVRNFVANGIVVHNCIYQWRGADPSIILNVCADYDIQKFILSTNYRCAGDIVDLAAVGIKHNTRRSEKEMQAYNSGGEIKICDCGNTNLYVMSKYAYKHIKDLIINKRVNPNNIAILSRNNAHLSILSNMLFKDGIHCESSLDMKMTKSSIYRDIKDVLSLAENSYNSKLTENTLNKVCIFLGKANAIRFGKLQDSLGMKLSDLLGYMATKFWKRADIKWNGPSVVPALAELNMAQSLSYLNGEIVENLILIYKLLTDQDQVKRVTGLLALYLTATEFRYKDKPDRKREVEGLVDYISELVSTMGFKDIKSYLKITEQFEEGKMAVPGPKVCMSTMHGAKGREWEHVLLFADDNVTFPSFCGINTQVKSGIAMSDIYYGLDENRRLHYVAMTRAKKQLVVFTDRKNTGLYLLEALGIFDYGAANNAHIVSMASTNELYPDILKAIDEKVFNSSSRYYYPIDISDLTANIEINYLYRPDSNAKQSISLDDIQTAAPVSIGE